MQTSNIVSNKDFDAGFDSVGRVAGARCVRQCLGQGQLLPSRELQAPEDGGMAEDRGLPSFASLEVLLSKSQIVVFCFQETGTAKLNCSIAESSTAQGNVGHSNSTDCPLPYRAAAC